jgi:hypothetical protein
MKTCLAFLLSTLTVSAQFPAFPGAEGFGAAATGGSRNAGLPQTVCHVTNLNDDGPGSFRDAISAPGHVIVFDVGGYIHIEKRLHVPSNTTIAGETAPGDGICFKDEEVDLTGAKNVIIRNIRFRQGTDYGHIHQYSVGAAGATLMLDHCSIEWGRWDCIGLTNGTDITFQDCIIGEGLDPQRFGALVYSSNITFKSCLWINNHGRNPKGCGKVQYINNVAYNWETGGYDLGHSKGETWHEIIGNYYINGPVSKRAFYYGVNALCHVYQSGNFYDGNRDGILNGSPVNVEGADKLKAPWAKVPVPVTTTSARIAFKKVLSDVGTFPTHRDPVDTRLIGDVSSLGTRGRLANYVQDAGGWVTLQFGTAEADSDGDGLPDYWELAFPPHTTTGVNASEIAASGYTNLEEYLHWIAGPHAVAPVRKATSGADGAPAVQINLRQFTSGFRPMVTYAIKTAAAHGKTMLVSEGTDPSGTPSHIVRFVPATNYLGLDAFAFTAIDGDGDEIERRVSVLVSPSMH